MSTPKIILLLFIVPLISFSTHKYYLSLTQIEYRSKLQSVQVTINVFMDDIEEGLNKDYNINLQLTTDNELQNNDIYFEKYLKEKLHFKIDTKSSEFNYIGKEYDGDLVYFYLEIEKVKEIHTIEIENKILTTHFPKQENLVKAKVYKTQKSILLNTENDKGLLKF